MSENDIVCIGSAALDFVFLLDTFPVPDQISLAHWSKQFCGGSSANVAVGVSRLGLYAGLVSMVGRDSEGVLLLNKLISEGVDIRGVKIAGKTARTVVLLDKNGEKTIIADTECVLKRSDELPVSCIQGAKALYIGDCFIPVAEEAVNLAQEMGITSFLRVKNVHASFGLDLERVMNRADYVIMNEKASALIKGHDFTIVTRGKKGCTCGDIEIEGIPVNSQDTTGAGDAFCAGLMYQIVKGNSLEEALEFGNAAAALSTTVYGAMDSMPSRETVESLLQVHV
ncbi:MAG: carbohydrate kinase family protein [Theionarchaea archaeon]|nr:carbohydrate kinase family protein [Theionarchaea archaeon]